MTRSFLIALAFAAASALAHAQLRSLPHDAKRGMLSPVQGMTVELDGRRVELAAGAQIRDANNMIVLPNALRADSLVRYQMGADGKLLRAWILSPQEAARHGPAR